ncbi:hypothetical protein QJS10_CPB13g00987 [Acorus calamus]|uniref:Ycf15 n=1 Tax=Acorus calamus TaxID=4465 RepID=A0AAV9DG90_ACOCL|nr:hypothetical protein QJS10_CPB13g00987 [Acorus calamus]
MKMIHKQFDVDIIVHLYLSGFGSGSHVVRFRCSRILLKKRVHLPYFYVASELAIERLILQT